MVGEEERIGEDTVRNQPEDPAGARIRQPAYSAQFNMRLPFDKTSHATIIRIEFSR